MKKGTEKKEGLNQKNIAEKKAQRDRFLSCGLTL